MTLSDLGIFSLIDGIDLSEKARTSGLGSMTKINDSQPVKFNQGGAVQRFQKGGGANYQFASENPNFANFDPEFLNILAERESKEEADNTFRDLKSLIISLLNCSKEPRTRFLVIA